MSTLDELIKHLGIDVSIYKRLGINTLSLLHGVQPGYVKELQAIEEVMVDIAMLKPNTLGMPKLYEVCQDVCTNYPNRALDTLRTLREDLESNLDTPLRRGFEEKLREREAESGKPIDLSEAH